VQELSERSEVGSFAEFVAARSGRLLRVAYLLTRDWALAEDLLQTSLAKAWSAWRRIEGDPEPYVRKILVNTYTTWWRRRWHSERPTDVLPERPGTDEHRTIDERDQILRALGRLPRQQRAVLVLRYYEDLSEVEIAEALGISPGTVKSHAVKGLANLRLDDSLTAGALRPDGEEPAGTARLAAVTERVHQRRRQKVTAVVAACAVVLAAILGYALSPARRSAPQPATTPSPDTVSGFPRFQQGTQVVASTSLRAADGRVRLGWTPRTADVTFFVRCSSSTPGVVVWVDFMVDTNKLGEVGCEGRAGERIGPGTAFQWRAKALLSEGIRYDDGVDVFIDRATANDSETAVAIPADFVADIAVGAAMPVELYPFPPAPSVLPSLFVNGFDMRDRSLHVDPDPNDPLGAMSVKIPWGDWEVHTTLDSPGRLELSINGVLFTTCTKWEYGTGGFSDGFGPSDERFRALKVRRGDRVTLTVTPVEAPHAWQVWLAPA
jgi:RNA polymerase sigma-70 factor (sigma-E family)